MRSADTNHRRGDVFANRYLQGLSILTLVAICACGSAVLAQSGRNQTNSLPDTTTPKDPQSRPSKDQEPLLAFVVVTSAPDRHGLPYQIGYSQQPNLEYQARGGCVLGLRNIAGVKVSEDEDVDRAEAREAALLEDKAWVIWMELRWDKTTSAYDSSPFRLRYLLFEPRTGRIAASGVGKGIKQTWGKHAPRTSLEEQLQQAGRDIADQVLSEIKTSR